MFYSNANLTIFVHYLAETKTKMKDIKIVKIMSELGAGTRGASLGYDALWIASLNAKKTNVLDENEDDPHTFFKNIETIEVETENQLLMEGTTTKYAKYIHGIQKVYNNISASLQTVVKEGSFPLLISGAHSTAGGTIKGLAEAYPNKRIGVVWIDAHADIHSPYTTPSGNVHGMPLATALKLDNDRFQLDNRNIDNETVKVWSEICGETPRVKTEDVVYFAVRDTEREEDEIIEQLGIKNYTVEEIRRRGPKTCVNETLESLSECDLIYISFDVDSMDSMISKGTGTPVLNGMTQVEAEKVLFYLFESKKIACFEMVEINPTLDNECNKMAESAFSILQKVAKMIKK